MSESQLEKSELQTPTNTTKNVPHSTDDGGDGHLEKSEIQTPPNTTKNVPHSSDERDGHLEKSEIQTPPNTTKNVPHSTDDGGDGCSSHSELKTDALPPDIKDIMNKEVSGCENINNNNNKDASHSLQQGVFSIAISADQKIAGLHCQNLQIGNHSTMYVGQARNKETIQKKRIDEGQLKIYLDSTKRLSKEDLFPVANNLGCEWRAVGRCLGIEDPELEAVNHDFNKEGLKEICYQMLKVWFENNPSQCIVGNLAKALRKCEKDDVILQLPCDK